jgi:hypothetical protein
MTRYLTGIAGAAMLFAVAAPAPADAFAVRNAAGVQADQATVQDAQYYRRYRRWYGPRYRYGPGPYYYGAPYAYAPYPYYRRYYGPYGYGPGVGVRVGPLGFGVW